MNPTRTIPSFRHNNFDLIRLFAASQVAILHALHIMGVEASGIWDRILFLLHIFPGVPIFFFVSGYLITRSFESNSRISEYASNRILRVYPGLITAVCLSFVLIFISGYMASVHEPFSAWLQLFLAKSSILQFYNPDFMRGYGDGVLNGSLWTITVELQFYVIVPLLYFLLRLDKTGNLKLLLVIAVFFGINRTYSYLHGGYSENLIYKLASVSFAPWFYMFLVGMFFQRNFEFFHRLLSGKFTYLLGVYIIVGYFASQHNANFGNNVDPLFYLLLVPLVFSAAYSKPDLARRITRGNDFSYGIYIYHMPVVNFLIYLGFSGSIFWSLVALLVTVVIAVLSWFFIEKPCLKLKHHPFNPMTKSTRGEQQLLASTPISEHTQK